MTDLVSIVIPCYNQGRYIQDAVASASAQSHQPLEVIVVDDGSTEDIRSIVAACPGIRYVRQENHGVSAARNTGFQRSRGTYLVFLDSDDRLAPHAVRTGLQALGQSPEAAAAVGLCRVIGSAGEARPFTQEAGINGDTYEGLLRRNFIWMPAQVIYRRDAFASLAGFDTSVDACADYDMYLRLARVYRVAVHRDVVAEYRQHGDNMSADAVKMLRCARAVLKRQWPYASSRPDYVRAYAEGRRFWSEFYGEQVVEEIRAGVKTPGARTRAVCAAMLLLRYHPGGFAHHLRRKLRCTAAGLFARRSNPA